jgi:S-adenosylmethionine/arginine decarboxylase-like enzyme
MRIPAARALVTAWPRPTVTQAAPRRRSTPREWCAPWVVLATIDLRCCDRLRLGDPGSIRAFVPSLVEEIGMEQHGPLQLERLDGGALEGWSAMQLVETSSITVHTDEFSRRCFIDVFSCRQFDPEVAVAVAVDHFGGWHTLRVLRR